MTTPLHGVGRQFKLIFQMEIWPGPYNAAVVKWYNTSLPLNASDLQKQRACVPSSILGCRTSILYNYRGLVIMIDIPEGIDISAYTKNFENLSHEDLLTLAGLLSVQIENFRSIISTIKPSPGDIPELPGVEVYGVSLPCYKNEFGGDHIIYIDFKKRFDLEKRALETTNNPYFSEYGKQQILKNLEINKNRIGLFLADVEGHDETDATVATSLHQTILMGLGYELTLFGEATTGLFEKGNTRLFSSSGFFKKTTFIYLEYFADGTYKIVNSAHPFPAVFSNEYNRFVKTGMEIMESCIPMGMEPSANDPDAKKLVSVLGYKPEYKINEQHLIGSGDILLLYTDGLSDHQNEAGQRYFPERVETLLKSVKTESATDIALAIKKDLLEFNEKLKDDTSYIVLKKL